MGRFPHLWIFLCIFKVVLCITSENTSENTSKSANIYSITLNSDNSLNPQAATDFLKTLKSNHDVEVYKWYKGEDGKWILIIEASPSIAENLFDNPQVADVTSYFGKPIEQPQKVKDEYIVVLNKVVDVDPDDVTKQVSTVLTGKNIRIKSTIKIGTYRSLVIQATDHEVVGLTNRLPQLAVASTTGGVAFLDEYIYQINPNVYLRSNDPPGSESQGKDTVGTSACSGEPTGQDLWGLSRLNMNTLQDFDGSEYTAGNRGTGRNVSVYVFDTGIYTEHVQFQGRAVWGFSAGNLGDSDGEGHGTHVSGTAGSYAYGVAKDIQLIAVKVLNDSGVGSTADLHQGLQWAYNDYMDRGQPKTVWSLSLGGMDKWFCADEDSPLNVFTEAYDAGITIVAAAGNQDQDACNFSPGCYTETIAVAASTSTDKFASYSNYGSCVNIVAPGSNILSTYIGSPTATARLSGTSMATPHVTGAVARYMSGQSYKPSPEEVKQWLKNQSLIGELNNVPLSTNNALLHIPCNSGRTTAPNIMPMVLGSSNQRVEALMFALVSGLVCAFML